MNIQKLEKEGVTYYDLYIQCPNCRSKGVTTPNYSFKHYDCGGKLMLGDNALVYCSECEETVPLPLVDSMLFSCPVCKGEEMEGEDLYMHLLPSPHMSTKTEHLALAGMLVQSAGKEWLIRCIQNIIDDTATDETTEG